MAAHHQISSRSNQKLARVRSIRDGRQPGLLFVEGKRLSLEALRSPMRVIECFIDSGFSNGELEHLIVGAGISLYRVDEAVFGSVSDTKNSQGIVLIAERPAYGLQHLSASTVIPLIVYLHEVN